MYESPIKIIESAIDSFSKSLIKEKEDAIILEVQRSLGVDVDRGELLRAMQYDRFQYDKGYADAMASIVRCKDCTFCKVDNSVFMKDVFGNENETPNYHCLKGYGYNKPNHFCSYGERKDNEDS